MTPRSERKLHNGKPAPKDDEDTYLPPRKAVHPSEKIKWTRRFYLTLIWLFVMLTVALFVWGFRVDA